MITASLDNQSETAELYPQGTERYVRNPQFHFTQQTRENRTTVVASSPETTVLLEGPEAEFIAGQRIFHSCLLLRLSCSIAGLL